MLKTRWVVIVFVFCGIAIPVLGQKHPEFTQSNILKIETFWDNDDVIELFGPPDRTELTTAGSETPEPWRAIIYSYDMGPHRLGEYQSISNTNRFGFSADTGTLQFWHIELAYPDDFDHTPISAMTTGDLVRAIYGIV